MRAAYSFSYEEAMPLVCAECSATILLAPAEAQTRTYCSTDCMHTAQRRNMQAGTHPLPPGHSSEEGRQRSRQNLALGPASSKEQRALAPPLWITCAVCAREFPTRASTPPRFCSERCRKQDERARGLYKVSRQCIICAQPFKTGAYRPAQTCCRSCARTLAWRQKRSREAAREEMEPCPCPVPDAPFDAGPALP